MAEEEWLPIDVESKLNRKIDALQSIVEQQTVMIRSLTDEIAQLKAKPNEHLSLQNDRTHQLLEELKIIKQRELNMMLREKIPVPFFSTKSSFPQQAVHTPSLPSPLFLAQANALSQRTINQMKL